MSVSCWHCAISTRVNGNDQLKRLIEGDPKQVLQMLYAKYKEVYYGICLKVVHNDGAEAADIMQDALLKIYKSIDQFDPCKASLFTWSLNIVRNTAIDAWRKKKVRLKHTNGASLNNPQSTVVAERFEIQDSVNGLEPKYKKLVEMTYIQGYTQEEVSKILGIPLGTVKTRTRKAIQILRSHFSEIKSLAK